MQGLDTQQRCESVASFEERVLADDRNGSQAKIYPYGAHLTSWQAPSGRDWLFLSQRALLQEGKSIRGGVPIIFPQFNALGPLQRHGFARQLKWNVTAQSSQSITLQLTDNSQTAQWPHPFVCEFQCGIHDRRLRMGMNVTNTGDRAFEFTCALHTYLRIDGLIRTQLKGLHNLEYWDNNDGDFRENRHTFNENSLHFNGAIDRVFFDIHDSLTLVSGKSTLQIDQQGFEDTVVWNPGPEAAREMNDLADDEHDQMLCVEAAQIDKPVQLAPNESWQGSQTLEELT